MNLDVDLMEINEDSLEPKSLIERPWNPGTRGEYLGRDGLQSRDARRGDRSLEE